MIIYSFYLNELIGKEEEGNKRWESWKEKIKSFVWWKLSSIFCHKVEFQSRTLITKPHYMYVCQRT